MLKSKRFKIIIVISASVFAAFIVAGIALFSYFYMKAEIPDSFTLDGPIKVYFQDIKTEIKPGDNAYNSFANWINNNRKGWHKDFNIIDYAYDGHFEGKDFSMFYCYGIRVILWIDNKPMIKNINKKDFLFLYELNKDSNKKDGIYKLYYKSGKIKEEGTYKNDKKEGIIKRYYESGKVIQEETYKNNEQNGIVKSYYENGKLMEQGNYKDGKAIGIVELYDENGKLKERKDYSDIPYDQEVNIKVYDDEGYLEGAYFKNEKLEGNARGFYDSGKLMRTLTYENGKKEGIYGFFYESGKLKEEGTYKNDKKEGIVKEYDENGKLIKEATYKDGVEVNRKGGYPRLLIE